jgi:hypothetical protein
MTVTKSGAEEEEKTEEKAVAKLSGSRLHKFELKQHKPLGCSVKESLANQEEIGWHLINAITAAIDPRGGQGGRRRKRRLSQ